MQKEFVVVWNGQYWNISACFCFGPFLLLYVRKLKITLSPVTFMPWIQEVQVCVLLCEELEIFQLVPSMKLVFLGKSPVNFNDWYFDRAH